MFKKIALIAMIFCSLTILKTTEVLCQVPTYVHSTEWSACYQNRMAGCTDCTEQIITAPMIFEDCLCQVTYKVATCNCPEVRTFVEILYIRIESWQIQPCYDLVQTVHPGFPPALNMENYKWLLYEMYDDIMDQLFMSDANNYPCPESKRYFEYLSANCEMMCAFGWANAAGDHYGATFYTQPCIPSGCCTVQKEYCLDEFGQMREDEFMTGNQVCEGTMQSTPCPQVGDTIIINGIIYPIVWVSSTECRHTCFPPSRPRN